MKTIQPDASTTMLILCTKRYLASLVDELDDWKPEGATVTLYGVTEKAHDGFLAVRWDQPIPPRFRQKLREDEVIIDYFTLDHPLPLPAAPITRTPPQL